MTEDITQTPEQIACHYSAAMDSVNLISGPIDQSFTPEAWAKRVTANKEHLIIMLAKNYWTTEDLAPFHTAVGV